MKNIKKLFSLFFVVLVLLLSIPLENVQAAELRYGKTVISQMPNSSSLSYLYERLAETCKQDNPQNITIDTSKYKLTSKELLNVYHIFLADYPEYFWLSGGCSYSNDNVTSFVDLVIPDYSVKGAKLSEQKKVFEAKVNSLTQGLNGKSDYEKSLILHDRLAQTTEYTLQCNNHQNAYGALVEGKAVCAGYSKAYQHLLHKVGIPAWCVVGTSEDPVSHQLQNHEWNLLSLDGKWYYSDVTWDDQEDYLFYAYFNITTKQMQQNHTVTEFSEYLPNATATDANYFVKNNLVYSNFDLDKIANNLKSNDYKIRIYVDGDSQSFLQKLKSNFNKLMQKCGIPANYGYSYSTVKIGNEIDLSVNLIEPNHKHSLTYFAAKAASCTSKGSSAYYTCTCGKWFSDASAQNEIVDKQSVNTASIPHSPSNWKNDGINHWKTCTKCGIEIANSSQHHTDNDQNSKCDTCGYNLPKDQIAAPTTSTPVTNNNSTTNNNTETTPPSDTSSNTSSQQNTTTKEENVFEENDTSKEKNSKNNKNKDNKKKLILPIAFAGSAIIVSGAVTAIVIILKRK